MTDVVPQRRSAAQETRKVAYTPYLKSIERQKESAPPSWPYSISGNSFVPLRCGIAKTRAATSSTRSWLRATLTTRARGAAFADTSTAGVRPPASWDFAEIRNDGAEPALGERPPAQSCGRGVRVRGSPRLVPHSKTARTSRAIAGDENAPRPLMLYQPASEIGPTRGDSRDAGTTCRSARRDRSRIGPLMIAGCRDQQRGADT